MPFVVFVLFAQAKLKVRTTKATGLRGGEGGAVVPGGRERVEDAQVRQYPRQGGDQVASADTWRARRGGHKREGRGARRDERRQ